MQPQQPRRPDFKAGVVGEFVEQGVKPYRDDPKNEPSSYVVIKTDKGKEIVWGVGLPDAIYRADAKEGDKISLREAGTEKLEKTVIREVDGKQVTEQVTVDRRRWEAEVVEERKSEVERPAASSEARPVVENRQENGQATPARQQSNRLEQLQQEQQKKASREDLER